LAQSDLPGLLKVKIGFFLATGELDPLNMTSFIGTLNEQLCKAGNCAKVALFKDHSHVSEVFSPNTADDSVTGPILKWMKSVK
jgi:triacylglycerol lipase